MGLADVPASPRPRSACQLTYHASGVQAGWLNTVVRDPSGPPDHDIQLLAVRRCRVVQDLSSDRNHRLTLLPDDNFRTTGYEYDGLGRTKKATYADSKYVTCSVRVR